MPTFHVPKPDDRPDVEVLVDGVWCRGELRMWTEHDEGAWTAQVQHQPPSSDSRVIGTLSADDVRQDTVGRARGRQ